MTAIDPQQQADQATLNRFHWAILVGCALMIIFDGYDLAIVGIALPSIMKEMDVGSSQAGWMVSSALFGMVFGNILLSRLADRLGRRWTMVICVLIFSIFTAATALATGPVSFSVTRFIAGLGIGGIMPIVIAQMTEYSPLKIRSTLITIMFSGYSIGGMLAALLGKSMIQHFGWSSVFLVAATPILLLPIIANKMPESMGFLLKRNRLAELRVIVQRLNPALKTDGEMDFDVTSAKQQEDVSVLALFLDGRGLSTVVFWIACFVCLFMVYGLSSWLALLMENAGHDAGSALTLVWALNFGAVIGAIGGGWLADQFHIKYVLVGMYLTAAISITLLGYHFTPIILMVVVAIAGASTIGTQIVTIAYAGQFYPSHLRTTGIGWTLGIGRTGAICAPVVMGVVIGMQLPFQFNFMILALPAVIAALAIALLTAKGTSLSEGQRVTA